MIFRVRVTPRARLEYINPAVESLVGYAAREWYAHPDLVLRVVHRSDRRKVQDAIKLRHFPAEPVAVRWVTPTGAVVQTEVRLVPVRNRQGALVAVEGIAREVTKGRSEEAPARTDERFLRILFDQAPAGVVHFSVEGRVLHANRRMSEVTGYPTEELIAKRLADIAHPDDTEAYHALLRQLKSNECGCASIEARCVSKDGSVKRVRLTANRMTGRGANPECVAVLEVLPSAAAREDDESRLNYSGIEVDTDRLDVLWNGRAIPLTLKEVLLLRYMIRHRGEMLARDRLLRDVWGYEHTGRSRTLDVHVCRLRRKLPPLGDALVTIGHFGYTLSEAAQQGAPKAAS